MSDPVKQREEHLQRIESEREATVQAALARNPRSSLQEPQPIEDALQHFRQAAAENAQRAPYNHQLLSQVEQSRRERAARLTSSGIRAVITPEDFEWLVNDELPENTHALRTIKRWRHVRAQGRRAFTTLVMIGETGRGKTVSVGSLIAALGGFYCTMEDLVLSRHTRDQALYERARSATVLHVDELWTESDEGRGRGALFHLLNGRMGFAQSWTVLSGNPPPPDDPKNPPKACDVFAARYGERTMRRIEHQGEFVTVEGPDLRRKKKQTPKALADGGDDNAR